MSLPQSLSDGIKVCGELTLCCSHCCIALSPLLTSPRRLLWLAVPHPRCHAPGDIGPLETLKVFGDDFRTLTPWRRMLTSTLLGWLKPSGASRPSTGLGRRRGPIFGVYTGERGGELGEAGGRFKEPQDSLDNGRLRLALAARPSISPPLELLKG